MSALICDICGGNLAMDASGEFAVCESCGMKHSKERVKVKVQEIQGTVKIDGAVETVKGDAEKDRLLKNAESFIVLSQLGKAEEIYCQLTNDYPDDYRGWMGLLKCQCSRNISFINDVSYNDILFESSYEKWFSDICDTATTVTKLNKSTEKEVVSHINSYLDEIIKQPRYIYDYVKIFKNKFDMLGELKKYFLERYENVMAYDKIRDSFEKSRNRFSIFETVCQNGKIISISNKYAISQLDKNRIINCLFSFDNYVGFHLPDTAFDSEVIVFFEISQKLDDIINCAIQKQQEMINNRIRNNVCQHCGGTFKGVFNKVCINCGKPKDY